MNESTLVRAATANLTQGSEDILRYYLESNRMPTGILSFKDLIEVAQAALDSSKEKLTPGQLVKQVFGGHYNGPPLTIDNGIVKLNKRGYMSADGGLPPPVYDLITQKHGKETADMYQKAVRKEWSLMNEETRMLATETGQPFHRGHWLANKFGGAESARAGSVELAEHNQLHGADFRNSPGDLELTGRTSNGWLDDFYQWKFVEDNLGIPGAERLKQADLQAISNGVPADKLIAQRAAEHFSRNGVVDNDSIGYIYGSQLDRDETIDQHSRHIQEINDRSIVDKGYDPQRGSPASPEDIVAAQNRLKALQIQPAGTRPKVDVVNRRATRLQPANITYDTDGSIINPRPDILAIKSAETGKVRSTDPNNVNARGNPNKYTGVVPDSPATTGLKLLRIARNTAPMWASLPLGAAAFGQSANAAIQNPNSDTLESAAWDGTNLLLDAATLIPIPLISAGAEGAQKLVGISQAARQGQKYVARNPNLMPSSPVPSKPQPALYGSGKPARIIPYQLSSRNRGGIPNAVTRPNTRPNVNNKVSDPMAAVYRGFNKIIANIVRD